MNRSAYFGVSVYRSRLAPRSICVIVKHLSDGRKKDMSCCGGKCQPLEQFRTEVRSRHWRGRTVNCLSAGQRRGARPPGLGLPGGTCSPLGWLSAGKPSVRGVCGTW